MRRDDEENGDLYGWNRDDDLDDDWLAEQGELDWLTDPRRDESAGSGTPSASPASGRRDPAPTWGGRGRGPSPGRAETIARRRIVAALAAGGVVVVTVIAVVVATSGGGGSTSAPTGVSAAGSRTTPQRATPTTQPTTSTGPSGEAATTPTEPQPTSPSSSPEVTLPPSGTLKLGDGGAAVVTLQKALAALGLDVGQPDGSFGPTTESAVAAFQTAHGLTPDGVVGAATAKALNQALGARG